MTDWQGGGFDMDLDLQLDYRDSRDSAMMIEPEIFDGIDGIFVEEDRGSVGIRYSAQSDAMRTSTLRPSDLSIRFSELSDLCFELPVESAIPDLFTPFAEAPVASLPTEVSFALVPTEAPVASSPSNSYHTESMHPSQLPLWSTPDNDSVDSTSYQPQRSTSITNNDKKLHRIKAIGTWLMKKEKRALEALMPSAPVFNARKEAAARRIRVNGRFLKPGSKSTTEESLDSYDSSV